MKRSLPFLLIALVAISAVAGGALLYRQKVRQLTPVASSGDSPTESKDAHIRGNRNAPVTLEEFGDFQCPPCASLAFALMPIEAEYGPKLRVIYSNFPLAMHNHATQAAGVAEAAARQGKFWEMHDLLYRNQIVWSKAENIATVFTGYAESLGLDLERFRKDVSAPETTARIHADQDRGTSRGVTSTPTIFINGHPLPPSSLNDKGIRAAIDAALRGEAPPTPTPTPTATPSATATPTPLPSS